MSPIPFYVADAGYSEICLDGKVYGISPGELIENPVPQQAAWHNGTGRPQVDVPTAGAPLPDVPDVYDFQLRYMLSDKTKDASLGQYAAVFETLRTSGGVHTFNHLKQSEYTYSGQLGQSVFWMPRVDLVTQAYAGITDTTVWGAVVLLNGAAQTVSYHASVAPSTAVTAGQVWVSDAAAVEPYTGLTLTLFKFGTALPSALPVVLRFFPDYRVLVTGVPPQFVAAGVENRVIHLQETT